MLISVDVILPLTLILPIIFALPVTFAFPVRVNPPLMFVGTFTTNPLLGEISAIADPDFILLISPIEAADILNNPLPSPLNNDAETEPVTNVFAFIIKDAEDGVSIIVVSIIEAENGTPFIILTDVGDVLITALPLTNNDITLELT